MPATAFLTGLAEGDTSKVVLLKNVSQAAIIHRNGFRPEKAFAIPEGMISFKA